VGLDGEICDACWFASSSGEYRYSVECTSVAVQRTFYGFLILIFVYANVIGRPEALVTAIAVNMAFRYTAKKYIDLSQRPSLDTTF
jgi:hypothetical protein